MGRDTFFLSMGSFAAGVAAGYYLLRAPNILDTKSVEESLTMCKKCQMTKLALPSAERNKVSDDKNTDEVAEVVFFPDPGYACDEYLFAPGGCRNKDCKFLHVPTSLSKMCRYLREAEKTIDVCIYTLGNDQLVLGLLHALDRGVKVRVVIDHTMAQSASKQLNKLGPKGALVQEAASRYLMHNKFVVIDQKIGMTGSFNWTVQGSHGNYENVAIFSNKVLVRQFAEKFEQLWLEFADLRVPIHPASSNNSNPINPLKRAAWDGIIVGYEAPVNKHQSSACNKKQEQRLRRF